MTGKSACNFSSRSGGAAESGIAEIRDGQICEARELVSEQCERCRVAFDPVWQINESGKCVNACGCGEWAMLSSEIIVAKKIDHFMKLLGRAILNCSSIAVRRGDGGGTTH
jgi:hypothetical protein